MMELYPNVSEKVREIAEIAWRLTLAQKNPIDAAEFLNSVVNYYNDQITEEEAEFLQFYFDMKMEMMKE